MWKDVCAITSVTQPLLCEGKLMRGGWWPVPGEGRGMAIKHLQSDVQVPMFFEGNSACVRAQIYRVGGEVVNRQIRFVNVQPPAELINAPYGWQMAESGHCFFRGRSKLYTDPSIIVPVGWPCRTTLVRPCAPGHEWMHLELSEQWGKLGELAAELPHGECEIITIFSAEVEGIESRLGHAGWVQQHENRSALRIALLLHPPS